MEALADEFAFDPTLPWPVLAARLLGALILCGLIGLEREMKNRPAGLRTHMLVGLAAAVYTMVMLDLTDRSWRAEVRVDPLRIVEGVTGGVAFLAAGMIIFSKGEVVGLTTGASLWLVAAIGLCAGLGLWPLAVASTILGLVVVHLLGRLEERVIDRDRDGGTSPGDGG